MREQLTVGRVAVLNDVGVDGEAVGTAEGPGLSLRWGSEGVTELEVVEVLLARMRFLSRHSQEAVADELAVRHLETVQQWVERRGLRGLALPATD